MSWCSAFVDPSIFPMTLIFSILLLFVAGIVGGMALAHVCINRWGGPLF